MVTTGNTALLNVKSTPAGEYLSVALVDFNPDQYDSPAAVGDGANKLLMLVLAASRSDNGVKNRWNTSVMKRAKDMEQLAKSIHMQGPVMPTATHPDLMAGGYHKAEQSEQEENPCEVYQGFKSYSKVVLHNSTPIPQRMAPSGSKAFSIREEDSKAFSVCGKDVPAEEDSLGFSNCGEVACAEEYLEDSDLLACSASNLKACQRSLEREIESFPGSLMYTRCEYPVALRRSSGQRNHYLFHIHQNCNVRCYQSTVKIPLHHAARHLMIVQWNYSVFVCI